MNWVSGAGLVAAVSNAGGIGTLGPNAGAKTTTDGAALTGERLRDQISKVKGLTKNPFAVNIAIGRISRSHRGPEPERGDRGKEILPSQKALQRPGPISF